MVRLKGKNSQEKQIKMKNKESQQEKINELNIKLDKIKSRLAKDNFIRKIIIKEGIYL